MRDIKALAIGLDWFPEHGGGLDRYFFDFLREAGTAGIQTRGLVAGRTSIERETDGQVIAFASRDQSLAARAFAVRRQTRRLLREWQPDLVAAHFAVHALPSLDRFDVPLVVHFQGPWAMESAVGRKPSIANRVKHVIEKTVYRRADRCIVLSAAFGTLLADRYRVDPAKIRVVPGSTDVARFAAAQGTRQEARERMGWPATRRIVLCVRRLVTRMGLAELVHAVAEVARFLSRRAVPDRGQGIGGGVAAPPDRGHRDGRGCPPAGFVRDDDLPVAYRAADLSIVPTQSLEGFGLIVAESLAAGTPVLVTPVGGLPETVQALSTRLVLSGTGVDDIARGLQGWLAGTLSVPDEATCRAYAREHFAWSTGVCRIRTVYDEAIASRAIEGARR